MRRFLVRATIAALFLIAGGTSMARADAAAPRYDVKATWGDSNLTPGDAKTTTAEGQFVVQARNIGNAPGAEEALSIEDRLPAGVTATHVYWSNDTGANGNTLGGFCSGMGTGTVVCTLPAGLVPGLAPAPGAKSGLASPFPTGYLPTIYIDVSVPAKASGEGTNVATVVGGGGAGTAEDVDQVPFSKTPAPFGLVPGSFLAEVFDGEYPLGSPSRQASDHPFEFRTNFDITEKTGVNPPPDGSRYVAPSGSVRDVELTLPRGMIGNPEAVPKCDPTEFTELGASSSSTQCPPDTQVGYLNVPVTEGTHDYGRGGHFNNANALLVRTPIYNLIPPAGTPVDLAFNAGGFVIGHIYASLDPGQGYAIKSVTPNISSALGVKGSEVTIWGVPGDPAHDKFRYYTKVQPNGDITGAPWGEAPIRPFWTNPMDCGFDNGGARITMDSYEHPGEFSPVTEYPNPANVTGCGDPRFRFEPDVALEPTDHHAGAPTGLDVHLQVPQRNDEVENAQELYAPNGSVKAIATPPMKRAVVTFPEGVTVNPSAAQGLGSCTLAQIGISAAGVPNDAPVSCPDSSQYGTLTLHTPILPPGAQPHGAIYIARQGENPSGNNFLTLYLVIEEPERGIRVKIPGKVDLNPVSGQITTTFDDLPQFPVSDMQMTLKGGVRAALVNPTTCGTKTITAEFFSWQDPGTPHLVKSSYDVTEKPDGSPCVNSLGDRPFSPRFEAGTRSSSAGSYSPFVLRATRTDDDQEFSTLGVTLPPGLAAKFAGVSSCPDAGIARAEGRTREGQGGLEQVDPSCPSSSLIGKTEVGTGVGVPLSWVPGNVYLAGPYHGAPLSMVVISPAVIGPFDLGVVTVRTALYVNPRTAQGEAVSDPFPQIFHGIPVRIRDIRLQLDRPGFILNPTSCAEKQITATFTGAGGSLLSSTDDTTATLTSRFQAADCAGLGFKPSLSLRLKGGTHRSQHPSLRATLTMPAGGANIGSASVALPHSEFLDQGSLNRVCTRVQFAATNCPAGSVYGHVTAHTPLFDFPLKGNVYLGTGYGHVLPDLVAELKGPPSMPVEIDLDGRIDEVHGGIRTTFDTVPDAPVSSFSLVMRGGKGGLIENSAPLCARKRRATAKFTGQNARVLRLHPILKASCGRSGKRKAKRTAAHR